MVNLFLYHIAHHRPRRRAARAFFEPGFGEGRRQARPYERIRLLLLRLDRIALDDSPAALAHKVNCGLEQLRRKAAAPMFLRDEEAYHRPDRLFIDGFQDSRTLKTQKLLARRDRTPPDRLAVLIGDDSGRAAAINQLLHRLLVPGALLRFILRAREAWPNTPASSACATLAEERFKIAPPLMRSFALRLHEKRIFALRRDRRKTPVMNQPRSESGRQRKHPHLQILEIEDDGDAGVGQTGTVIELLLG